jgi:hypothetical protein
VVFTTQIVQLNIITAVAMLWIAAGQSPLCADNPAVWLASCETGCEVAVSSLCCSLLSRWRWCQVKSSQVKSIKPALPIVQYD